MKAEFHQNTKNLKSLNITGDPHLCPQKGQDTDAQGQGVEEGHQATREIDTGQGHDPVAEIGILDVDQGVEIEGPEVTTEGLDHPVAAGEGQDTQGHLVETDKGQGGNDMYTYIHQNVNYICLFFAFNIYFM